MTSAGSAPRYRRTAPSRSPITLSSGFSIQRRIASSTSSRTVVVSTPGLPVVVAVAPADLVLLGNVRHGVVDVVGFADEVAAGRAAHVAAVPVGWQVRVALERVRRDLRLRLGGHDG